MTENSIQTRRQRGFTLIELISVIIILGILAAVITPKYFAITDKATEAVAKGVKSEAIARLNMAYAKYVMTTGKNPDDADALADPDYLGANPVDIGDYTLTYSGGGVSGTPPAPVDVQVVVAGDVTPDPTANWTAAQKTFTFPWPQ